VTHTQPGQDGILRQALDLPDEQKARLDEALTRLEARIQSPAPEGAASVRNSGSRRRPDPAPAM
jgi:hypothetical protein